MVWSFAYEYMHDILCGVSKYIWNQWIPASDSKSCFKLNKIEQDTINKRLSLIKPSQDIHRLPESLHDRAKWKTSAEKSWLLYYSLPCLNGVISKCIMDDKRLLMCTLLHIVQSVKKAPLWSTSTFLFESIYIKKKCMNGPNRIDQQMSKKSLEILHFLTDNIDYCDVSAVQRMIQLHSGEYGQIIHIILLNNKCHMQISKITISSNKPFNVSYMNRIESEDMERSKK
ncbi:hypothetical protein ACFW04_014465 [Cataglyphis niger]